MSKRKDGQTRGEYTLELKLALLRAELARGKMERDILKGRLAVCPVPYA